ncbi:OLC1v1023632C1 [Oldenlandia corymbosa var. corymbosa]|uniref:OLC1v1023632C1 n=1 Tax=Oldenlandia corymbosa var. corymbosa TaxID=529605 RepID=A0AAV1C225_OLDCO|nr:OLC1v1023632C1 [Oldenlandia corymbosa var. corymbosa]
MGSSLMVMIAIMFSSCILISLGIVCWKVFNWAWLRPKKLEKRLKRQGFRGNRYRLVIGDFKDISDLLKEAHSKPIGLVDDFVPRVVPHFLQALNKYGKNLYVWLGPHPAVVIMDPELIRTVAQRIDVFQKPEIHPLAKFLVQGLFTYDGDKWAKHRRILNPAFHMDKLKLMMPAVYECAHEMLTKWEEMVPARERSIELDICPFLESMTADAISRTAFGSSYEKGRRIFQLQKEQAELFGQAVRSIYIPGFRFVPTKRNRRMKQIYREVDYLISEIINSRLEATREGEAVVKDDDLLGLLLKSNSEEIDKHGHKKFGMSIKEVIEECKLFYLAGQETTSVLLVWTMILLSRFPDWQARAREEVWQQFGTETPDFDGLNQLKIVTMILYEVLRLYPPFPVLGRKIAKDTKLGDFIFPAGVQVTLPVILLHHDPEVWGDDVKEFKPERFAGGIANAAKTQGVFFPFGRGPRVCIGQAFAMLEAKLTLATILQRFSFELSPSYSHAPFQVVALQPQYGAHLILYKL